MVAGDTFTCPVAAAPYRAYGLSLPAPQRSRPGKRSAARQWAAGSVAGLMPGGGCALPGLRAVSARSVTIQAGQAQRRPAMGSRA